MLKAIDDVEEAHWVADVLDSLGECSLRLQRPLRSTNGAWTVNGWSAWEWLEGDHASSTAWPEVIEVAEILHAALADVARPAFLERRRHPWSIGDRAAWGEAIPQIRDESFLGLLERLYGFRKPLDLQSQVIHGDLLGNVLFEAGQPPAVIDFSPYYRPSGFAIAIIVVDAIAWQSAGADLTSHVCHLEGLDQLLARAAIFRLVSAALLARTKGKDWATSQAVAYEPILDLIGA